MTNNESLDLTLVMIAKNEAKNIRKAIESAAKYCKEIIVADTGSTDATSEVSRQAGAVVYSYPWSGSFSEARNFALGFVRTPWVLTLDADEELDRDSFEKYCHLLDDNANGGIRVQIINTLQSESGTNVLKHKYTRVFRSHPEIRYTGRIHEQIAESIEKAGFAIADSEIVINHNGYESNDQAKAQRNLSLLLEDLAESPEDPFIVYHIGETQFALGNYTEAQHCFSSIYTSIGLSDAQKEMSRLRIAQIWLRTDEANRMREILSFSSADTDREGFRKYLDAIACLMLREFAKANELLVSSEAISSGLVDQSNRAKLANALALSFS